jgi:S1-C subfamily serine protease
LVGLVALVAALGAVLVGGRGGEGGGVRTALAEPPTVSEPAVHEVPTRPRSAPAAAPAAANRSAPDLKALGAKVAPGLVNINTVIGFQNARSAGTGIVLTSSGEVVTNNHVINGATSINATDVGNGRVYRATVVGYDRTHDVAVVRLVGATGLAVSTIGDSDTVRVGDHIAAVGNAGGVGGRPTTSGGRVTALGRSISPNDELTGTVEQLDGLIEVAANVQPGDSGGPLVDSDGEVVGIDVAASASRRGGAGRGYAIPINSAMEIVQRIRGGQASESVHVGESGMLGIAVVTSPSVQSDSGVTSDARGARSGGVLVKGVQAGAPAAAVGLRRGDVLQSLDGVPLDDAGKLTDLMSRHHPGDQVTLEWLDAADQQHSERIAVIPGPPA